MLNRHSILAPNKLVLTSREIPTITNKLRRFPSIVEDSKISELLTKFHTSQASPKSDLRVISDRRKSFRFQRPQIFGSLP